MVVMRSVEDVLDRESFLADDDIQTMRARNTVQTTEMHLLTAIIQQLLLKLPSPASGSVFSSPSLPLAVRIEGREPSRELQKIQ